MPVITEALESPSTDRLPDLAKVLDTDTTEAAARIRQWLEAGEHLYCGIFNGRAVALVRLQRDGADRLRIADMVVRDITRGRSVGRQLLRGVLRNVPPDVQRIDCDISSAPQLADALAECGFNPASIAGRWRCQLKDPAP